jgi:hypothetical protein
MRRASAALWHDLRMEPEDDPEARIRDLERSMNDVARNSKLGVGAYDASYGYVPPSSGPYPPPPPGSYPPPPGYPPTASWDAQLPTMSPMSNTGSSRGFLIPVVIAVLAFVIAGGVSAYLFTKSVSFGPGNRPDISGGGATLDSPADGPSTGGGKTLLPTKGPTAPNGPPAGSEQLPPGTSVTVSGIGQNKTIDCNETILNISGVENTVTVTGHCVSLTLSGIDNVVTVDSTDSIGVSGFDNRIVFHNGEPQVSSSGSGNTVDRG